MKPCMFVEAQAFVWGLLYTDTYGSYNYIASYIIANLGVSPISWAFSISQVTILSAMEQVAS